jgi:hypothetical protein
MKFKNLVEKIPVSMHRKISEKFVDALLETKEGVNVPTVLAKTILYHSMQDQLASKVGLGNLFEALIVADRVKADEIFEEFGLSEIMLEEFR